MGASRTRAEHLPDVRAAGAAAHAAADSVTALFAASGNATMARALAPSGPGTAVLARDPAPPAGSPPAAPAAPAGPTPEQAGRWEGQVTAKLLAAQAGVIAATTQTGAEAEASLAAAQKPMAEAHAAASAIAAEVPDALTKSRIAAVQAAITKPYNMISALLNEAARRPSELAGKAGQVAQQASAASASISGPPPGSTSVAEGGGLRERWGREVAFRAGEAPGKILKGGGPNLTAGASILSSAAAVGNEIKGRWLSSTTDAEKTVYNTLSASAVQLDSTAAYVTAAAGKPAPTAADILPHLSAAVAIAPQTVRPAST